MSEDANINQLNDELALLDEEQSDGEQYLMFDLAGEEYGVDILRVEEIRGWESVTRIPNAPQFIKGVLNLRGAIVPIVDLRQRFHLEQKAYTATTVIVVLSVEHRETTRIVGIVVDGVANVVNVTSEQTKATPKMSSAIDTKFISGLFPVDDNMMMLLDIDKLLSPAELGDESAIEHLEPNSDDEAPEE